MGFGKALHISAVNLRYYDILGFGAGRRLHPVYTFQLPGSHKDIMSDRGVANEWILMGVKESSI